MRPRPGAERSADRNLSSSRRAAREQQIRDIRARNDQNQPRSDQNHGPCTQNHGPHLGHTRESSLPDVDRRDASRLDSIATRRDHSEVGMGLSDRNAIFQPSHQHEPTTKIVPEKICVAHQGFLHSQGHPECGWRRFRSLETGRRNADDDERSAIQSDCLSDQRRVCVESAAPQGIA